ncbi:MAG: FIST N-terminal domain-containing protein [Xanthomonadaceae bacterium]|nr:FIST N-terminal domain-containing protein [Xanthomonadaceae bacterium]
MKQQTAIYRPETGWVEALDPRLDSASTLILAFGANVYGDNPAPFKALREVFPNAVLMGCSSVGEVAGARVEDNSISIAVAQFEHTSLRPFLAPVDHPDQSWAVGRRMAEHLDAADLAAIFILSDGVGINGSKLVRGVSETLRRPIPVSGGLAGDGGRFDSTWILANGQPSGGYVSAVGFYGDRFRVGLGSEGGWTEFGPERRITHAQDNRLYELDGQPALDLYKDYLGELAGDLPGAGLLFPIAIRDPRHSERFVVRTILGIDEIARSMTFAGDVPEGFTARLMRASDDRLIDSAAVAVSEATRHFDDTCRPLIVSISCVGRRLVLGQRTEEEIETVLFGAPSGAGHIGFYSHGEISTGSSSSACDFHNQTMTISAFHEQ